MAPIQNGRLSPRYPFKCGTKPAVSLPDLLTPRRVLCASTSDLAARLGRISGGISVLHVLQESALLQAAISSATHSSTSRTARLDVMLGWNCSHHFSQLPRKKLFSSSSSSSRTTMLLTGLVQPAWSSPLEPWQVMGPVGGPVLPQVAQQSSNLISSFKILTCVSNQ